MRVRRVREKMLSFKFKLIFFVLLLGFFCSCRNNLSNDIEEYTGEIFWTKESNTTADALMEVQTTHPVIFPDEKLPEADKYDELNDYSIPHYWLDELSFSVDEAQKLMSQSNGNYTAFMWYTDAHWSYGAKRSVSLLQYLEKKTGIRYTNFGGDIVSTYNVEADENLRLLKTWREETLKLSNHHSVVGNHDDDIAELKKREDLYAFLISPELNIEINETSFSYFVDDALLKTRYIYLSTGFEEITSADLDFIIDTLHETPSEWHVVFVSHIWFLYDDATQPTVGDVAKYVEPVFLLIDAYNNRSNGVMMWEQETVEYDFSDAEAKVAFCIGGHTHVDFCFATPGGVPVILTQTDSFHIRTQEQDIANTNEASVNIVIADYEKNVIHIVRVGRGESFDVFF